MSLEPLKEIRYPQMPCSFMDKRIAQCPMTGEEIEQVFDGRQWVCLHDN